MTDLEYRDNDIAELLMEEFIQIVKLCSRAWGTRSGVFIVAQNVDSNILICAHCNSCI